MKILTRIAQVFVLLAVAASFAQADNFMYFKKKSAAAPAGYHDTFTANDGTHITAHTSEGVTWTYVTGNSADVPIASNMVYPEAWQVGSYHSQSTSDTSQAVVKGTAAINYSAGPCVRMQASTNGYCLYLQGQDHTPAHYHSWMIREDGNYGGEGLIAPASIAITEDITLKIVASGDQLTAYINGVDSGHIHDSTYASGYAGFQVAEGTGNSRGLLDDWQDH
jgi:hypothetical protein